MLQHLQSLALALATHIEQTRQQQVVEEPAPEVEEEEDEEEDDRVSVAKEQVEVVEGPPVATEDDVDDLQNKTSAQLRELLTKKGIPFGKRDSKTTLLELLKATA